MLWPLYCTVCRACLLQPLEARGNSWTAWCCCGDITQLRANCVGGPLGSISKCMARQCEREPENRELLESSILASLSSTPLDWLKRLSMYLKKRKNYIVLGTAGRFGLRRIWLGDTERKTHAYIVGITGKGKSKLIEHMIFQDIVGNRGCGILDPHSDLIDDLLSYLVSRPNAFTGCIGLVLSIWSLLARTSFSRSMFFGPPTHLTRLLRGLSSHSAELGLIRLPKLRVSQTLWSPAS